ncbi:MAG: hypothetical protein GTO18_06405 [Anaerolineales bacterium]|nr:hypothetical protein [Anaerolineales bacterium]
MPFRVLIKLERILADRRGEIAETAVTLPVILLAGLALVNLTIAGFASVNATNAASYGARMGSVNQEAPAVSAMAAANNLLSKTSIGDYSVYASGGGRPGDSLAVTVQWSVPNYFRGLMAMFGQGIEEFTGTAVAYFRQEGW